MPHWPVRSPAQYGLCYLDGGEYNIIGRCVVCKTDTRHIYSPQFNTVNKLKIAGLTMAVLAAATPFVAAAQYSTTTAAANVNTAISDVGATIGQIVPVILVLLAALIGLGWGVRKFKAHVSGRKF